MPLETFGGQDLIEVHTKYHEQSAQRRNTLQAKFASMRDVRPGGPLVPVPEASSPNPQQPAELEETHGAPGDEGDGRPTVQEEEAAEDKVVEGEEPAEKPDEENADSEEKPEAEAESGEVEGGDEAQESEEPRAGPTHTALCDGCQVSVNSLTCNKAVLIVISRRMANTLLAFGGSAWCAKTTISATAATRQASMMSIRC